MDDIGTSLQAVSFTRRDLIQDEQGNWFHLPTLRALHAAGRLAADSAGFLLLMQHAALNRPRMIS
ncbi:hypothetical protein [Deinococcus multiflagellatus]|uniref:Uncharacterized protein n=1 Tax=Deinococcus multiflagellatus TaxID=1656887 RepID=A0ABW1ZNW5_9DEIO|nr:hypothetical protein [Deinococcus multiflagellatus]MBZ9715096.1 hypothetical protein [Deinococcus multiflagellatus]